VLDEALCEDRTKSEIGERTLTTTHLLLIRHGENDWVGTDRLAGRTPNVHLNERGREQSLRLAQDVADLPVQAIYSSPLERCMETAQPVADALSLAVEVEEGVMEADFGDWQGESLKELAKLPEWKLVQYHPTGFRFPNGEHLRHMQARAVDALEALVVKHPDQLIAVFSHSDVIRVCMAHYLGVPLDLFQRIMIGTASVSGLTFRDGRTAVLFVNRTSDLPTLEIKKES
jgi:probable phosphoglycerate mutase